MSRDPNCLFCKIVAGEIPSTRVLETDRAVVILDINPVVQGHLLIIPRDHHVQLLDLPDDLAAHAGRVIEADAKDVGWNVGGGVYLFPAKHLGIRGDLRRFQTGDVTWKEIGSLGDLPLPKFDFWRATAGVTIKF